jgi:NADH dehydrogenase (ubiquinone) Fe-S protein 6
VLLPPSLAHATGDDPALGCPVEYINLKGTSKDNPAVCKYTGAKYYSEDWHRAH